MVTSEAPIARVMVFYAAILFLGALLTGGFIAAAMTGRIDADPRTAVAAHMSALLGALLLVAVAWSLRFVSYGEAGQRRLAYAFIVSNYANWIVTAIKATLHVSGVGITESMPNNAVFVVLNALVVLPSLAGAAAWVWGLRPTTTANRGA